jgi:hypothetical protein
MAKFSTGLRNGMLATDSFKNLMDGSFLNIYSGTVPASADDALGSAVLLCTITESDDGTTGLTFGTPVNGVIPKTTSEVWEGTNVASGTASFWRLETSSDTGASSTTEHRVQGTIGSVGTDMLASNNALTEDEVFPLNYFNVALPTL